MSDDAGEAAAGWGCLLTGGAIVICFMFGFPAFVRQWVVSRNPNVSVETREVKLREALGTALSSANFEIRQKEGDDVEVFVARKDLEALPFPDRAPMFTRVANVWCPALDVVTRRIAESTVTFRDIKSGAIFGEYRCGAAQATVRTPD